MSVFTWSFYAFRAQLIRRRLLGLNDWEQNSRRGRDLIAIESAARIKITGIFLDHPMRSTAELMLTCNANHCPMGDQYERARSENELKLETRALCLQGLSTTSFSLAICSSEILVIFFNRLFTQTATCHLSQSPLHSTARPVSLATFFFFFAAELLVDWPQV